MATEKIKLTVTEVSQPKPVGDKGARKLEFKAKNPEGKELPYFTFSTRLFDYIKTGANMEVDVDIAQREYPTGSGNVYTDRKVTQLYENGQPVGGQRQGGFSPRPDNTASIEAQTAAKIGGELLVAGTIKSTDALGKATIDWCLSRLNNKPKPQP